MMKRWPRAGQADLIPAGSWVNLDSDAIHQMGNQSDESLVTLHYYARPLRETLSIYLITHLE